MQLKFYLDQTRCTGCETCVIACKDWNDIPAGPANWRRVKVIEKGKYPDLFVAFLSTSCYHCAQPSCVSACPAGAISKRAEDGIVVIDQDSCLGHDNCDMCLQACPYGIPQFGAESNAKMQKCDFCADRWSQGKKPICVDSCPVDAIRLDEQGKPFLAYPDDCTSCLLCETDCPVNAINVVMRVQIPTELLPY